ncbi:MAG: hypothetical protein NTV12_11200 [Verrucomicrobia bacterium]|nr:hypothetical protein [Verrucomicrobiota bacterium]
MAKLQPAWWGESVEGLPMKSIVLFLACAWVGLAEEPLLKPTSAQFAPSSRLPETTDERNSPDQCQIGLYVLSLYDLNGQDSTFSADFWVWFNHKVPDADLLKSVEFINAKEYARLVTDTETNNVGIWATEKIKAKLFHEWSTANFPFESHNLKIVLEEGLRDSKELVFELDTENSKISKGVKLDGWKITRFQLEKTMLEYDSTFGDPEGGGGSSYSGVIATINLKRTSKSLF